MVAHIQQAAHNELFHSCIEEKFNDKFFDWKITTLFYTALHWIHALAEMKGINIGETHSDVRANCNPRRHGAMPLSEDARGHYNSLYNYSHTARYDGLMDMSTFEILKQIDHGYAKENLEYLRKYFRGKGLVI